MAAVEGKEAGSGLKLYVDPLSQPCRSILIFCRANGINAEEVTVSVARGEQRTPEYLSINPLGKVPSIDDGGFKFNESHAILRYLATTRDVADHWYPKDAKRRALIDNVLDWQHLNLSQNTRTVVQQKLAKLPDMPAGLFPAPDESVRAEGEKQLKKVLEQLETVFLQGPGKFLANGEQVSIADLSLVCELKELVFLGPKEETDLLGPRKKITAWMDTVEEATNPHFSRVTAPILSLTHDELSEWSNVTSFSRTLDMVNRLHMESGV